MPRSQPTAYDLVEYPDQWYPQSHPDRLSTIATLHGLDPAHPEGCRVLELGCGAGWNLIHMAATLPGSEFVGADLAPEPIRRAQRYAAELGVTNVTFEAVDLADVDAAWGTFDYVVAHGVYSWVPEPVRDRLMAVAGTLLEPQGVAYVSYATYPGRYLTRVMREMMMYHARRLETAADQARHARGLLNFLRDAQPGEGPYRRLLDDEIDRISQFPDQFFYHDDLSEVNEPCYFHEFAAHAARHGLQYLSEANFHETKEHRLSREAAEVWKAISEDIIDYEQYRDFLAFRRFRQTLLCRAEVDVQRRLPVERLSRCFVGAPAQPVEGSSETPAPEGDGAPDALSVEYAGLPDARVVAHTPLVRAALDHLGASWPHVVGFDELVEAARRQSAGAATGPTDESRQDREEVGRLVLELYGMRFCTLLLRRPGLISEVSTRPEASPVARWQARSKHAAASLLGINVLLDPLERWLLPRLDGTRDLDALRGALGVEREALGIPEGADLDEHLDTTLRRFALEGLLVA